MASPIFNELCAPANPDLAKRWLIISGVSSTTSGVASIGAITHRLSQIFPTVTIDQRFTYIALAISFICGMFLLLINKVVTVGLAQLGAVTGFVYIGYAIKGVFFGDYRIVFVLTQVVIATILVGVFSGSIHYYLRAKHKNDARASAALLIVFAFFWILPIFITLKGW